MKNSENILEQLKRESEQIEIPESLKPEQMRSRLEEGSRGKTAGAKSGWRKYQKVLATAACACIVLTGVVAAGRQGWLPGDMGSIFKGNKQEAEIQEDSTSSEAGIPEEEGLDYPKMTYEEIYAAMSSNWQQETLRSDAVINGTSMPTEGAIMDEAEEESVSATDSLKQMTPMEEAADLESVVFGTTNVQTAGVDEGDLIKNDGRYLYQVIQIKEDNERKQAIQIVDTEGGLHVEACVEDFDSISEFYVWEDALIVIENKYMDNYRLLETSGYMLTCGVDVAYKSNYYHEISFYSLEDISSPEKIKSFTLQGHYASSRIADGYFYGFSRYYANPGEGEADYDAYVPKLDGKRLQADSILMPEGDTGTSYLVMVSVDLENPTDFVQTLGIVADADLYYVSSKNIYVTNSKGAEGQEGWVSDSTALMRFSYGKGKFVLKARGEVPGSLEDSFSLDEYDGHLRAVSTVREYQLEILVDDRTGETIGSQAVNDRQTNALYVLDENLEITGKIEGLAEDERIYSARFLGATGYFVTFRQVDPLFAVDLSDPTSPEILSELKISGFSEYLHFYGKDRLLGIGMEADEETGRQEGMKLSMFDISDPTNVQEIAKLPLEDYNYSEALYNHKAVLINPSVNIFGFDAEGSQRSEYWRNYLVFSYENDTFVQKLELDAKGADGGYYTVRGTFIGDVFYLLSGDGSVESYDWNTGEQLEDLEP